VSGPVTVEYPPQAKVLPVISTEELLETCQREFPQCDGVIGAAAPCDYRPVHVESKKIAKTGQPLELHLVETPDVMASLGAHKRPGQWLVGFALETDDQRFRALGKLIKKSCDLIVLNGPAAMDALDNQVEIFDKSGIVVEALGGSKDVVATAIMQVID